MYPNPFDTLPDATSRVPYAPARGLGLVLAWESASARHVDSRFLRCPEPATLPPNLRSLLDSESGSRLQRSFNAGDLVPDWQADRLIELPGGFFRRTQGRIPVEPHAGRFYPGVFLANAPGLPPGPAPAFRVAAIGADGSMQVDLNHPLAGIPLDLEIRVIDPAPDTEAPEDLGRVAVSNGPGMQARWRDQPTDFHSGDAFARVDSAPDAEFYAMPRLVHHLDQSARERISHLYQTLLPDGAVVLDLMSSWASHLNGEARMSHVAGLGMNAQELAANPVLNERVVQDLNTESRLPWPDASFDAVLCTVSVEYLIHPVAVFREVRRILRPGGPFVISFSNRWFPPKAIAIWGELHEFERMGLVLELFHEAGGFRGLTTWSLRGLPRPPGDAYAGRLANSDPVYAVWGHAA